MQPAVDVVIPFGGSEAALAHLLERIARLDLGPGDSLTIVDNRPAGAPQVNSSTVRVLRRAQRRSSYFARNEGAAGARGDWLLFLDADVEPPPDLIKRYFEPRPNPRTAVLAGGVIDEPLTPDEAHPAAVQHAALSATMSQSKTLSGSRPYAQTANCAVRRTAFEQARGFRDDIRSGGDADLCWRLFEAGWGMETREAAPVVHRSRRTLREVARQRARHGSGAAWLNRQYPGVFPRGRWAGLAKWTVISFSRAAVAKARGQDAAAAVAVVGPVVGWAFELGRLLPNEVMER